MALLFVLIADIMTLRGYL